MLCLITNRNAVVHGDLIDLIHTINRSEVDRIILREKDLGNEVLLDLAKKMKDALRSSSTQLLINGSVLVAKEVGAHGVHFPFDLFQNSDERFGITGVSIHSVEEALYAQEKGADYLIAGHIYDTNCKLGLKARGHAYLKAVCEAVSIPVIAIGGIKVRNIPDVKADGASGIAVMSTINGALNPLQKVQEYQAALKVFKD